MSGNLDPYNRRCYDWKNQDKTLLKHYKKLGAIRRKRRVFESGETTLLKTEKQIFAFCRGRGRYAVWVAVNLGKQTKTINFKTLHKNLYTGEKSLSFDLVPNGFLILARAGR